MDITSNKPINELNPETQEAIKKELSAQIREIYAVLDEAGKRYTQYNFIVNSGGSAAVLAFLGTNIGSTFAIWPLLFFIAGVIACGVELLAMVYVNKTIFNDALNRRNKFGETDISIEDLCPKVEDVKKMKSYQIAWWASFIAFGSFIAGVFAGGFAYFCTLPQN